jgi:hypothetical protein
MGKYLRMEHVGAKLMVLIGREWGEKLYLP